MSDNDLDRRLGELFAEPNLALPPRADATGLVLTRVRRARRRRRTAQLAVPVLAAVLLGGVALSGLGSRLFAAPAPPAHQTTVAPRVQELPMSGPAVGPIRLGMTRADAEATGLLITPATAADTDGTDCWSYRGRRGIQNVMVSPSGVVEISVYAFITTGEGAAVGTTYAQVHTTYPDATPATPDTRTDYRVPVPGQAGAWYVFGFESPDGQSRIGPQSRVIALTLTGADRSCD
jgi:hypothetical protein